ncbi:unnamed protein product [Malus baccata var. baccata]
MEQSKGRRVIIFPLPFQGHINSMLELANVLHSRGFSITIIHTRFNSLNPSTLNPHFTYHSIPVDFSETEAASRDPKGFLYLLNVRCVEPFRECLAGLLSDDVKLEGPVACLISDTLLHFTRPIAESFKLPRILLDVSCATNFAVLAAFPLLKEKGYLPIQGTSDICFFLSMLSQAKANVNIVDWKMEQGKGRRLVLFPFPVQGHINPMLELANILHSKGFSIAIIYTNFNSLNPSTLNPHFTYHSIPVDLTENEDAMKDLIVFVSILNAKCVEPFRECLAGLLSDDVNSEGTIACLITDLLFDFTRSVAESFKLPRIMLRTGGAASFVVYSAIPLLKEKGYLPISNSRLEEPVTELSPIKVKDLPTMPNCDPEDFYQFITNTTNESKASYGLIFNTFEDLEGHELAKIRQEYYPNIPIFPIGPFHKRSLTTSSSSNLANILRSKGLLHNHYQHLNM